MFQGIIDDAKSAANEILSRVATRAAIGVVFLVAVGFATAGLTLWLVDRFGGITASWILAAAFAAIGLIGLIAAKMHDSRQEERKAEEERLAAEAEPPPTMADATTAMKIPLALVGSLLTTTSSFISPVTLLRFLARNAALVAFTGLLAMVLWPQAPADDAGQRMPEPAE